jgi:hypothetical protein
VWKFKCEPKDSLSRVKLHMLSHHDQSDKGITVFSGLLVRQKCLLTFSNTASEEGK